jgi:tyrosine-protein kinase Etk/Wzc
MSLIPLAALPVPARRLIVGIRERRFSIAAFVLGVTVLSIVVSLLLRPWFTAQATILPPSEEGDTFANLSGLIESSVLSSVGLQTASDVYMEILKSRRLREALAEKFDLRRLYRQKGMDLTLRELAGHLGVKTNSVGVITVTAEDHDRRRAADMANFLVSELDRFNRETLQTRGKRTREFLEKRVAESEQRMHEAAAALTAYEEKHKVVVASGASAVSGIADVVAQKLNLQVRRAYVSSYSAPGSSGVREIDAELAAFDRELGRLPVLKNEGARLALEAEVQGKLFTLLTAQYEQARIQEMRDTPTVTVLDVAHPPELKSRPRRSLIVLGSAFFALLLSVGWVGVSVWRTPDA